MWMMEDSAALWQLKPGAVEVPHYGLLLAKDAGFPAEVMYSTHFL